MLKAASMDERHVKFKSGETVPAVLPIFANLVWNDKFLYQWPLYTYSLKVINSSSKGIVHINMMSARLNWIWTPLILWWIRYFHIIPKCKLQASTFKSKHQPDLWNLTSTPFHVSICTSDIMKCSPDIMKPPSLVAIQWLPKSASAPKCTPLSLACPEDHWPDRGRTSASPALFSLPQWPLDVESMLLFGNLAVGWISECVCPRCRSNCLAKTLKSKQSPARVALHVILWRLPTHVVQETRAVLDSHAQHLGRFMLALGQLGHLLVRALQFWVGRLLGWNA